MKQPTPETFALICAVADRLRGDESLESYLGRMVKVLDDLANYAKDAPQIEELEIFLSEIVKETLRRTGSPGCRVVKL